MTMFLAVGTPLFSQDTTPLSSQRGAGGEAAGGKPVGEPAQTATTKPRYTVRKTTARTVEELDSSAIDLKTPENLKTEAEYDETSGNYIVGTRLSQLGTDGKKSSSTAKGSSAATGLTSRPGATVGQFGASPLSLGMGTGMGQGGWLGTPIIMTPGEYQKW